MPCSRLLYVFARGCLGGGRTGRQMADGGFLFGALFLPFVCRSLGGVWVGWGWVGGGVVGAVSGVMRAKRAIDRYKLITSQRFPI